MGVGSEQWLHGDPHSQLARLGRATLLLWACASAWKMGSSQGRKARELIAGPPGVLESFLRRYALAFQVVAPSK